MASLKNAFSKKEKGVSSFSVLKASEKNFQKFFWQKGKKVLPLQPQTKQRCFKNTGFQKGNNKIFSGQKVFVKFFERLEKASMLRCKNLSR